MSETFQLGVPHGTNVLFLATTGGLQWEGGRLYSVVSAVLSLGMFESFLEAIREL